MQNGVPEVRVFRSDGFRDIPDTGYTLILSNPPYHTDFRVAKHFIEKGFNRLAIGGKMVMVTKRRDWYKRKLIAISAGYRSGRWMGTTCSSRKSALPFMPANESAVGYRPG